MCGIVGGDASTIFPNLRRLQYRGYDSGGAAFSSNGRIDIVKWLGPVPETDYSTGTVGIGHTRWATHGKVCLENAHPFTDCTGKIAVVHNGIIENYLELKERLSNHVFKSDTDSEVIAHLVEEYYDGDLLKAVHQTAKALKGSYAFACLKDSQIAGTSQGCPLAVSGRNIASDTSCFVYSQQLRDGDFTFEGRIFDGELNEVERPITQSVKSDITQPSMLQEIMEQRDREWDLRSAALEALRARDITFIGCGSSRYAAIVGRFFLSRIAGVPSDVVLASELQNFSESISRHSLVIAISQSGETADVIEGVKLAREHKAKVISIINRPDSLLGRLSDMVIPMNCGPELAVAATKSFTTTLCILYHLANEMAGKQGTIQSFMSDCREVLHGDDVYLIAKGINYPIALEGALKLKEVAYIHAEAIPAGEMKHGSLALVEPLTPIIAVCPKDENYDACINSVSEIKARGGYIIGISDAPNPLFDKWVQIPNSSPMSCVVPLQLMAYNTAIARGIVPERPRNLAKSVTVK